MKVKIFFFLAALLLCAAPGFCVTPQVTITATGLTLLGTAQPISLTAALIDPGKTGVLRISGGGTLVNFRASTVTPANTAQVGPVWGTDVVLNGLGVANSTFYLVQVFVQNSGGFLSSTPAFQQFYAFTGTGTYDLVSATPILPNAFNTPTGVSIPGNLSVSGGTTLAAPVIAPSIGPTSGQQHTIPAVASDTFALLAAAQTLTNKTLTSPTSTGTDSGTETLTNKTLTSPTTTNLNDTGTQLAAKRFVAGSTAINPTCAVTGAGPGASCAMLSVSSSDTAGAMLISTGTGPGASGTATLTFSSSFVNGAACTFTLANGASSWNARASVIIVGTNISQSIVNWDNNAVNLTASQANSVAIAFICVGHN